MESRGQTGTGTAAFTFAPEKLQFLSEQRLSDAFEPAGSGKGFEWTAKVINIGGKHNEGLLKKCKALYDYCSYVNRVKGNRFPTGSL